MICPGFKPSACMRIAGGTLAMKRLEALKSTNNGQEIAEEDLKLRQAEFPRAMAYAAPGQIMR